MDRIPQWEREDALETGLPIRDPVFRHSPFPLSPKTKRRGLVTLLALLALLGSYGLYAAIVGGFVTDGPQTEPFVTLGPLSKIMNGTGVSFGIVAAHPTFEPSNYEVNLSVAGMSSTPIRMPLYGGSVALLPIHGVTYRFSWTDGNGDGKVNPGDTFAVWVSGVAPDF